MGPHKNNVAALRQQAGLTQDQLAELSGIGVKALGKLERQETRLNQYHQDKLSRAFNVAIEDLAPRNGATGRSVDAPLPRELAAEIDQQVAEFILGMGDRLQPNKPVDPTERAKLIGDAGSWLRAALVQLAKRGSRT